LHKRIKAEKGNWLSKRKPGQVWEKELKNKRHPKLARLAAPKLNRRREGLGFVFLSPLSACVFGESTKRIKKETLCELCDSSAAGGE
jgi:hypothetical protein